MKVIHVVPSIRQEAAGPSYSVPRLCQSSIDLALALRRAARDVEIVHNHGLWSMVNVAKSNASWGSTTSSS